MEWYQETKDKYFPNDLVSDFWKQVADIINPHNPTLHYGLINEHLEQLTFLHGHQISIDDIYLASKLMTCVSWNKLLTSKTRPSHITRWFMHISTLYPNSTYAYFKSRTERIDGRLIKALEENDIKLFEILLDLVDINARSPNLGGACPIHIASLKANRYALDLLISKGASLETQDKEGLTPIFYAVQSKSMEIFNYMISIGANIFHIEKQGRTLFYWAASLGRLEMLDTLIGLGLDPDATTKLGRTALSKSAWNGSLGVTEYLLRLENINVDIKDKNGRTALHNAVWGCAGGREGRKMGQNNADSPECALALIEKGADIEAVDNAGNTPMCIACSTYAPNSLELLIRFKANIYHHDYKGLNPYHQALGRGNLDIAERLVKEGMPVNFPSPRWSCMQVCIKYGETGSLNWLIDKNIKPTQEDYQFAITRSELPMLQILIEKFGVPPNLIEFSIDHGDIEICEYAFTISEITEEYLKLALSKEKALAEIALSKWKGKITSSMMEKIIELKIDPSDYLDRTEPTGSILRLAIKQKNVALAQKILDSHPDLALESDSYSGNTALHIACQNKLTDIIPKLVSVAPDPVQYILQKNKKEMTSILICQSIKFGLSIAELLKSIVTQANQSVKFSLIKALEYTMNSQELTPHLYKDNMPVGYWPNPKKIELVHDTPYT